MTLTQPQQRKVEQNLGLVGKVIKDKVHNPGQNSIYSYDDLYQIGCIGLCKAAYSDKGGCFSTYAYRLIWNEICTALIYANRRAAKECELLPEVLGKEDSLDEHHELSMILDRLEANASEAMAKGIRAIRLSAEGYSHAEIAASSGKATNVSPPESPAPGNISGRIRTLRHSDLCTIENDSANPPSPV